MPAPLEEAVRLVKPKNNLVDRHSKLTYDTTDMWFYLKADSAENCHAMSKVSLVSAFIHQEDIVHRGNE